MLSRFSLCGGQTAKKCLLKLQPVSAITTSAASSSGSVVEKNKSNVPPEFPPPTSKRDHVNFPRLTMAERSPPVRMGFIPESWFKFFYPKTGYTGPYMFVFGLGTYMFSKEIIVYEHNLMHSLDFVLLCVIIQQKFGDKIANAYNNFMAKEIELLDEEQEEDKKFLKDEIADLENMKPMKDAVTEVTKARTEVVHLQMELAFRERIAQTYKMVKQRLDCQAELEDAERRIRHRNLMDYVVGNVMKSITPELEKNALQACINDLNALSARA